MCSWYDVPKRGSGAEMLAAVLAEQAQLTFSDISVALPLIEERS